MDGQNRFFGLLAYLQKSKCQSFNYLKERIEKKYMSWKEKFLSKGGKEVLIKAISSTILVYAMSTFRLPSSLCDKINSIMANFWWGQQQNERKLLRVSWSNLCNNKEEGGLSLWIWNASIKLWWVSKGGEFYPIPHLL